MEQYPPAPQEHRLFATQHEFRDSEMNKILILLHATEANIR